MKNCAICGAEPQLVAKDMGRGNGHGYPGQTNYMYKCPKCGIIQASADDIYDRDKEIKAPKRAIQNWNKEVDKIQEFLDGRKSIEPRMNDFVKKLIIASIKGENIGLTEDIRNDLISIVMGL